MQLEWLSKCVHVFYLFQNSKKTDIKNKIEKARTVVSEYTSAIETMRLIRDKKLADINSVQLKIEVI